MQKNYLQQLKNYIHYFCSSSYLKYMNIPFKTNEYWLIYFDRIFGIFVSVLIITISNIYCFQVHIASKSRGSLAPIFPLIIRVLFTIWSFETLESRDSKYKISSTYQGRHSRYDRCAERRTSFKSCAALPYLILSNLNNSPVYKNKYKISCHELHDSK